ncbi:hypothetical protein B9Z55_005090 [Caenorhabditis nigoni]|uniref:E3 ubiquitin-protein ligase n=1 Tax=Caenorhabditis nigoni TaxID=1611254 RepID=A0A2G5UZB9_9PELO|nr:hypothetical protein B9Z55_005090 [Caenorhabditis nigoni]
MPPGEPLGSISDPEDYDGAAKKSTNGPNFKKDDWHIAPLLNFDADLAIMEMVYPAVAHWTQIAKELKSVEYPIAEGIDNWRKFDKKTRIKAQMLDDFLDLFISKRLYTEEKDFEVLRVLIAQGKPYLEFKDKMAKVNFSLKCNNIWENEAVAYRCNTCAFTPCMSLCEACFEANGHHGHDYVRFFSREGGACDCGNQDVIRESGNCPDHGDESQRPSYDMSDVVLAEYIVTKLLVRMFLDFRGWTRRYQEAEERFHHETADEPVTRRPQFDIGAFAAADAAHANKIIEFLQECSNYGGPMRLIVSEVLQNKSLYKALTEKTGDHFDGTVGRIDISLDWRTYHSFKNDRESVLPTKTQTFSLVQTLADVECFSLLDELIFWINRQLFPQNLVNFGLSLLSEPGYRDAFAYRFFRWYPICGKVIFELCISQNGLHRNEDRVSPTCSRAVHVTVQMLSSAQLCKELNESVHLVRTIFEVTRFMICERLVNSEVSLKAQNIFKEKARFLNMTVQPPRQPWTVMTMAKNAAISQHGYWFVMGDIQNVLTHTNLAVDSISDEECFGGAYMRMMCEMQGMNPQWRIISGNAQERDGEEEVQSTYRAYTLEFETLAVTLFNIVAAIQTEKNLDAAKKFFDHVIQNLENWFHVLWPISDGEEQRTAEWSQLLRAQAYTVSFHIPLHRHISTALTHFTELDGFNEYIESTLLKDETMMRMLILHPIRIQVARSEINCNMWVRNGAQARMSALIYSQWNVSSAFQTPDVDLIRWCAAHIDKEHFAKALTTSFNLTESIEIRRGNYVESSEESRKILEGVGKLHRDTVPEEKKFALDEYRRLIRDNAILIERSILGYTDGMNPDDVRMHQEVMDIMIAESFATELSIDYRIASPFQQNRDPRMPIVGEFIRRHLAAAGVAPDGEIEEDREFDPTIFDDEDVERRIVIREHAWIDPMFWGMFKLVAELIVVRVNSGASSEDHYRSEMVNCMAMGNVPYSRLRASISEKGSRGSENIDKHFERILMEIGDFVEPMECANHLQSGSYQLKTSIWDSEVCPVFFMMRSTSIKQAREVFSKMQAREKKNSADKQGVAPLMHPDERFWVPFRLIDFDEKKRNPGISKIYNFLLSERFLLHCVAVLASEHDQEVKLHDCTIQLAVYLMTLAVKYVQEFKGEKETRNQMIDIFHTPFKLLKKDELDFLATISTFMLRILTMEAKKSDQLIPIFRKILSGDYDREKVTGGKLVYLARFMSIMVSISPTTRELVQEKLTREEHRLDLLAAREESQSANRKSPLDPGKKAAKEAAKRRMEAIMQKSAKKSAATMKKLMATEGMSADEVSTEDPSQQNRKMYECPICGELETPNTVEMPFGMLAKLSTNFVCEEQIDASFPPIAELLDYDSVEDDEENLPQRETRRHYADKRKLSQTNTEQPEILRVIPPMVGMDLKTCGHVAHIECFNAYRASLHEIQANTGRREAACPLCRYPANAIIPVSLDKPYVPVRVPHTPISDSDVWKIMDVMLKKAKGPVYQEDEKNVKYATNYSTREGGGLCELYDGRRKSADWTERQQSNMENCTTSTMIVSVAVAIVERSSLLRRMGAPERRKNSRRSMTEHIMTASVATSKDVDFDVTMSTMTNLFAKVSEATFKPSTSSSESVATSSEKPKSVSPKLTPKKQEEVKPVAGLTSDEMAAMITVGLREGRKLINNGRKTAGICLGMILATKSNF